MATVTRTLTPSEAEAEGFIVDHCCYPWLGYKGDRFSPTETVKVLTTKEAKMLELLEKSLADGGYDCDITLSLQREIYSFMEDVIR